MQALKRNNVLAPGPVNLHPQVREALAQEMIHHRTPEFDRILKSVLERLKSVFSTTQDCFILTSTGSGGMECLLVNTMSAGDLVLGINSGKFGERWCEMATTFGGKLIELKVPWGEAADPAQIKSALMQNPKIKIVLCQACETSTGVKHPIEEIGKIIHEFPNTLFLVDGITALGAFPIKMDDWHIDGLVGGSQKAFMLPTGLCLLSFSKKAWAVIEKNPQPRFYFDIRKEQAANQKGETYFSSNVTLIRALDVVLNLFEERGLAILYAEIQKRAEFTRKFTQKLGLTLYAKPPSESLTAVRTPPHLDSSKIRLNLEQKFGTTIMGGQDEAKGKILRIGHMGYITSDQMIQLIQDLSTVLAEADPKLVLPKPEDLLNEMQEFWK